MKKPSIPWRNRLEVRILFLSVLLPLAGVLAISAAALFFLQSGLVEIVRTHTESAPLIVAKSIGELMANGRPESVKPFIAGLDSIDAVEEVRLVGLGEMLVPAAGEPAGWTDALKNLRGSGEPQVLQDRESLVFFQPLVNGPDCISCHATEGNLLGAAVVGISLRQSLSSVRSLVSKTFIVALAGVGGLGFLFLWVTRSMIVIPVKQMHSAALSVAEGDLTVEVPVSSGDEIGMLARSFKESQRTLSSVISRINSVSARVADVSAEVEKESALVVEGTGIEADAFEHIAAAMEELNASMKTITASVGSLTRSSSEAHEASQEMAMVHGEVFRNIDALSTSIGNATATTGEMSHTIRELHWGAEQLSVVSQDTLQAVQSLEDFLRGVSESARTSASHSEQVTREAEELGAASVRNTIRGMEKIKEAVRATSTYISSLGGMSKQIGAVVDVIDEVTDQTTLLALNAAILAAQAGKEGQGFKVVAAEIRKLATRSASSTVEISKLITSVQENVAGAVTSMEDGLESIESGFTSAREAGMALDKIVGRAVESMDMAASISEETGQQSRTLAGIRETMEKLDSMAQFLARGTAQQKREAASISSAAENVQLFVGQIRQASEVQLTSSREITVSMETAAEGAQQISRALEEEQAGGGQIMKSLAEVVDLPGRTRGKAIGINQGLRGILNDIGLLQTEVQRFTLLREEDGDTLNLGVVPLESPAEMHSRFMPLVSHLSRKLGRRVVLRVALDFAEAVSDLGEGRTHIAYLTPSTYVSAREKYGVVLLVKALREGQPFHHSMVVTTAGTKITSLSQLRGRSFAFGDPRSTSSHIVPRAMLKKEGIALDRLGGYAYLGHHDDVAKAVLNGEYDAGAVMESVAERYTDKGLVVIATSPPVPEFNVSATASLSEKDKAGITEALLELSLDHPTTRGVLESLGPGQTGFVTAEDRDYDGVSEMMGEVDLGEDDENPAAGS